MKKFVFFSILSFLFLIQFFTYASMVSASEISRFVFTSSPQIVGADAMSQPITLQAQDVKGAETHALETYDVVLSSTSDTGKFVGKTGKTAGKTMNKNTANKTVYYTDSALGTHILTAKITGRTTHQNFSASQQIVIAKSVSPQNTEKKSEVVVVQQKNVETKKEVISENPKNTQPVAQEKMQEKIIDATSTQEVPRQVAEVFVAQKETGFVSRIFSWPIRAFEFVRRLFVED